MQVFVQKSRYWGCHELSGTFLGRCVIWAIFIGSRKLLTNFGAIFAEPFFDIQGACSRKLPRKPKIYNKHGASSVFATPRVSNLPCKWPHPAARMLSAVSTVGRKVALIWYQKVWENVISSVYSRKKGLIWYGTRMVKKARPSNGFCRKVVSRRCPEGWKACFSYENLQKMCPAGVQKAEKA